MIKRGLVIGYGASGKAVEGLLQSQGFIVFIYDDKPGPGVIFTAPEEIEGTFDLAIVSPGVSLVHPICTKLKMLGVPLYGEAEYALRYLPQRKIGITGTNGKTTLTYLCEHILKEAGYKALACGNVSKDKALSSLVDKVDMETVLLVELSSFQLETLNKVRFESSIVLNITPDHLDRYPDMTSYARAKMRLQSLSDLMFIDKQVQIDYGDLIETKTQIVDLHLFSELSDFYFETLIDKINAKAAYLLLSPFNISLEIFKKGLKAFKKPAHRLERVKEISGVEFINDSKATNIDAVVQALKSMRKKVILLAGGVDKGHPYTDWIPYLDKVKEIVCFGNAQDKIYTDLSSVVCCTRYNAMLDALLYAYSRAEVGEVVLLSPGGSSFDAFKDYADRGDQFTQGVLNLKPKENAE